MRQRLWAIGLSISIIALSACQAGRTSQQPSSPSAGPSASQPTGLPCASPSIPSATTAVERVIQQARPSIVKVDVSGSTSQSSEPSGDGGGGQSQAQGTGTGMVLDNQGHILTNNHVVTLESGAQAQSITVDLPDGKTVPANVVGTDPLTDLAVIQVGSDDRGGLTAIQWADASSIVVGEPVVAIGVVSGIGRSISETDATISGSIQTDAAINPGNSGGLLLDDSGKVIGINTAGLTGTPEQPAQGLNLAISAQTAQPVVQALVTQGHVTRGYAGVGVTDITPQLAQTSNLGVSSGAGIGQVSAGAPADKAGLKVGDVITKVGDVVINNTGDLTNALTKYGPGQGESVTYYRAGHQATTTITLGQRPSSA